MDETMDDDAKDPGIFQQRSASGAKPEDTVAENMDEAMDGDSTTTTARTPHTEAPRPANWDQLSKKQKHNRKRQQKKRSSK